MTARRFQHQIHFLLITVLAVLGTLLVTPSAQAGVNKWTPTGPAGGSALFDFDPHDPETLYARSGILKSTTGGAQWTPTDLGLPQGGVVGPLLIDPSNSETLYTHATCTNGHGLCISKSTNGGESWSYFPLVLPGYSYVTLTTIDPQNSRVLYASAQTPRQFGDRGPPVGATFRSTDGGETWTNLGVWCPIYVDRHDSNIVYCSYGDLLKSVDGGISWRQIWQDFSDLLFLDPMNSQVLYALSYLRRGEWKSVDGGETWTALPLSPADTERNTSAFSPAELENFITFDPTNSEILYEVGKTAIYKSLDGGLTWTPIPGTYGPVGKTVWQVVIHPFQPQTLFAAVVDLTQSLYKSTDAGVSWTPIDDRYLSYYEIDSLAIAPSNSQILYATPWALDGYHEVLFKSTTGGQSWEFVGAIVDRVPQIDVPRGGNRSLLLVDPTNPEVLYVEGLRSADGGKTWETFGGRPFWSASAIVIDPTNPAVLYAANEELPEGYDNIEQTWVPRAAITKSIDGGQTWTVVYTDQPVCGLALAPSDPQILYAMISGSDTVSLIESTDGGKSWTPRAQDIPLGCRLVVDPLQPRTVYVVDQNGLFKSTDEGNTWSRLSDASIRASLVIDPINPLVLYLGNEHWTTDIGVLKSTDGGLTWSTMNQGLLTLDIHALVIDPSNPRVLYAGTGGTGVVRFEQQAPISVKSITPTSGSTKGGTVVTISGENFLPGATVTIGGSPATNVTVVSPTSITATTPPGTAGTANVVVINPDCMGEPICSTTLANAFTYVVPPPPTVQLTPTTLDFGAVKVGKRRQLSFTVKNIGTDKQTVLLSTTLPFSLRSSATVTVKPGKSTKVKVQFAPTTAETFTGMVLVTDPTTEGSLSVSVSGVGVGR